MQRHTNDAGVPTELQNLTAPRTRSYNFPRIEMMQRRKNIARVRVFQISTAVRTHSRNFSRIEMMQMRKQMMRESTFSEY